jgi:acetyltransferase-like isoleucine patch superfamily enzyme
LFTAFRLEKTDLISLKVKKAIRSFFFKLPKPFREFTMKHFRNIRMIGSVQIGDYSYVCRDSKLINVQIGKYCSIGERCSIGLGGEHNFLSFSTFPFFREPSSPLYRKNPGKLEFSNFSNTLLAKNGVVIGHDVWIGEDVTIKDGVTIGNGAVIGAKSMVTHDVLPYAIVGGNPARLIKYRFSQDNMDYLQNLAWWDWPPSEIFARFVELDQIGKENFERK